MTLGDVTMETRAAREYTYFLLDMEMRVIGCSTLRMPVMKSQQGNIMAMTLAFLKKLSWN